MNAEEFIRAAAYAKSQLRYAKDGAPTNGRDIEQQITLIYGATGIEAERFVHDAIEQKLQEEEKE